MSFYPLKGAADKSKNKEEQGDSDQEEQPEETVHETAQQEDAGNLSDQDDVTGPEPTDDQQAPKPEDASDLDLPDEIQLNEEDGEGSEGALASALLFWIQRTLCAPPLHDAGSAIPRHFFM